MTFTRLYLLVSGLTLVFGAVDLWATSPFMLKYEAAVTNIATGAAFVAGAIGRKPIIGSMTIRPLSSRISTA
jgi:intracellular septation protein A